MPKRKDDDEDEGGRDVVITRCTGAKADGSRCTRNALEGSTRCSQHGYRMPGRPSKLNATLTAQIVYLILEGNYLETAAQAVGVDKGTLHRWTRRADEALARAEEAVDDGAKLDGQGIYDVTDPKDWPYLDFRHALKSAEAFAETELVRKVQQPPGWTPWQAFATILERRHPARWKRREAVEHEGALVARAELIVPDTEVKRDKVVAILANALNSAPDLKDAIVAGKTKTKPRKRSTRR